MAAVKALDLFCSAGGATKGLQRAGFHVTGVDIVKQPRYCGDAFHQADALDPPVRLADFDFIWASPPCHAYSSAAHRQRAAGKVYPDLIAAVRHVLIAARMAWCIENVPGAPIRGDVVLSGAQFDLDTHRTRVFEISGFPIPFALSRQHKGTAQNGDLATLAGHGSKGSHYRRGMKLRDLPMLQRERLARRNSVAGWRLAIGCPWMSQAELSQAIPPAYAEYIGRAAMAYLSERTAA